MNRILLSTALILLLSSGGGCSGVAPPSLFHPGSLTVQRNRALRFDPYPETQIGPNVDGGRPREYQHAPPEPSRARWQLGNWGM